MNTRVSRFYLASFLLLAGCVVGERHDATIQRRWPASAIRTVEVVGVDGSMDVEAGPPNEVTLIARVKSIGITPRNGDPNQGYFDTDLSGDTLRIGQERGRGHVGFPFGLRSRLQIDY